MAETKSKKARAKKGSSGSASKAKSKAAKPASGGSNGSSAESVADSVKNGAQGATEGVGPILQKAKLPLLAGGAAVAGVAGAVLASKSGGRKKVLGVPVPKGSKKLSLPKKNGFKPDARKVTSAVTDAAKRADDFGQGVSRIASSVRKVGETAEEAVKKS
jgi:hypothetical protein